MNKCPRCESEILKSWNHCPKCGLKLEMTREQAIEQLKDLVKDRESFCVGDYDVVFELDIQALKYAIKELERTTQEVSVQEQSFKEIISGISALLITASSLARKALEINSINGKII